MSSKVTGHAIDFVAQVTAADADTVTMTPEYAGTGIDLAGIVTVDFQGANVDLHFDVASGRRRYRVRIEEVR